MSDSTGRVAQVVPDLATFAVDDGFSYAVPDELDGVTVGSVVRVPLGNRRIRGYVVSVRQGAPEGLKPIISVSGEFAVFDSRLLETLRWAALHYVAPLAVLLSRAAPPNLPRGAGKAAKGEIPEFESRLPAVSAAAAAREHHRPTSLVISADYAEAVAGLATSPLRRDRNIAVVAPTVEEAQTMATRLREWFGSRVRYVSSQLPAKEATAVWVAGANRSGLIIVGTPEIAMWPLGSPALWVVIEEGRRAMKAKQTPTIQVRDVVRRRALVERSALVMLGPVPTLDALAKGAATSEPPGRVWPLVELVDRREDDSRSQVLARRTVAAIRGSLDRGGQVFVFVSRRGYAPAFRCVRCRELRRCPECGAGPDRGDACRRCATPLGPCVECGGRRFEPLGAGIGRVADELVRQFGPDAVGPPDTGRQVMVGTERDLLSVPATALTVAVDADSMLMAPHYRAEEDALRILARVAATVSRGRGNRCLMQSSQPEHPVLTTLRSGHPLPALAAMNAERERDGLPPSTELLAIEVAGDVTGRSEDIEALGDQIQIHGPELGGDRTRWFLQGGSLQTARVLLRTVVQRWRDAGLKVRIDADPVDL